MLSECQKVKCFQNLAGKHTGKIHLGRPIRRWEDNIRIDLYEIGVNTRNLVDWAEDSYY